MSKEGINVLALGGCGDMGRHAVRTALKFENVASITIADIDIAKAEKTAAEFGPKTTAQEVDVTDKSGLSEILEKHDLVLNTVGPFFKFGTPILNAAIEAKTNYLDINDDWEPTLEMMNLHGKAEAAGVTAIIGIGASPGMTNLLARKIVSELDIVTDLYTGWNVEAAVAEPPEGGYDPGRFKAPDYRPSAALIHGVQQFTGKIRVRRNGRFVDEKPLRKIMIDYPGLGRGASWSIGHPEALTLPRYFPSINNCLNVFVGEKKTVNAVRLFSRLVDWRILSPYRVAVMLEKDEIKRRGWEKDSHDWIYPTSKGESPLPPVFAFALGEKNGSAAAIAATIRSTPPGKMGGATGVPLAIGLSLMADGLANKPGVFAPEGLLDPDEFFNRLAPLCEMPHASAEDFVLITRSWEEYPQGYFENAYSPLK